MNKTINLQNYKKLSEAQKRGSSSISDTISNEEHLNPNLQTQGLTIGTLKVAIYLKFGSYAIAGQQVNLSTSRTKQLLNGHYLPKSPDKIKKIAKGWGYDPVVLALLFNKYRREDK